MIFDSSYKFCKQFLQNSEYACQEYLMPIDNPLSLKWSEKKLDLCKGSKCNKQLFQKMQLS